MAEQSSGIHQVDQHLAGLPDHQQSQIGRAIGTISHDALIIGRDSFMGPTYAKVSPEQYDEEQISHNVRVEGLLSGVAEELRQSADLMNSGQGEDAYVGSYDIALEAMKKIKTELLNHEKTEADSISSIRNGLLIGMSNLISDTERQEFIRDIISSGNTAALQGAMAELDGIVAIENGVAMDLGSKFLSSRELLILSTGVNYDDRLKPHETGELTQQDKETLDKMYNNASVEDLITLAALSESRGDRANASRIALDALEKLGKGGFYITGYKIANIISRASEMCSGATEEGQGELNRHLDNLRSVRQVGEEYRQNDNMTISLDIAMVELAVSGRFDLAAKLLSSSTREFPAGSRSGPLELATHYTEVPLSENDKDELLGRFRNAFEEKVLNTRQQLMNLGAPEVAIDIILNKAANPDSALLVDPEYWKLLEFDPGNNEAMAKCLKMIDLMVSVRVVNDLSDITSALKSFVEYGVSPYDLDKATLNRILSIEDGQGRREYASSFASLISEIDLFVNDLEARGVDTNKIQKNYIVKVFAAFRDPAEAFKLGQKYLGDSIGVNYSAFANLFYGSWEHSFNTYEIDAGSFGSLVELMQLTKSDSLKDVLAGRYTSNYVAEMYKDGTLIDVLDYIKSSEDLGRLVKNIPIANLVQGLIDRPSGDTVLDKLKSIEQKIDVELLEKLLDGRSEGYAGSIFTNLEILHRDDPNEVMKDLSDTLSKLAFIDEAEIEIDYISHIDMWTSLARSIPEGKEGNGLRRQILSRLNLKSGEDPTQAIRIFTQLQLNENLVSELDDHCRKLIGALSASEDTRGFMAPSDGGKKLKQLFISEALQAIYEKVYALKVAGDTASIDNLMVSLGISPEAIKGGDFSKLVKDMKELRVNLTAEENARNSWINQYAGQDIKAAKLIEAWRSRPMALERGIKDSPNAILDFVAKEGVDIAFTKLRESGYDRISQEEYEAKKSFVVALGRRYSPDSVLKALERVIDFERAKGGYDKKILAPNKTEVNIDDRTYIAEVLPEGDPRAFTIGYDTGCCMTLGGASESCIWAGVADSRYSFFAVYEGQRLRAQSLIYATKTEEGETVLVIDNIEANAGTDLLAMSKIYKDALVEFIERQGLDVKAIQLGVGWTDDTILSQFMPAQVSYPGPIQGVYSDAYRQRVVWGKQ